MSVLPPCFVAGLRPVVQVMSCCVTFVKGEDDEVAWIIGATDGSRLLLGVDIGGINDTTSGLILCPLSSYTLSYKTINYFSFYIIIFL